MYNEILPFLDAGKNVILDRYIICVKVFTELFLRPSYNCLSKALECLPNPDIGIYLNVDIDTAFARIQQRSLKTGVPPHYSESKQALILKQTKYEEIIPSESYPVIKVNANQDINMVYSTVLKTFESTGNLLNISNIIKNLYYNINHYKNSAIFQIKRMYEEIIR